MHGLGDHGAALERQGEVELPEDGGRPVDRGGLQDAGAGEAPNAQRAGVRGDLVRGHALRHDHAAPAPGGAARVGVAQRVVPQHLECPEPRGATPSLVDRPAGQQVRRPEARR